MSDVIEKVDLDTSKISHWKSIFTLIVFVIANITVLFPFHIPLPVPLILYKAVVKSLVYSRVIPARQHYDRRKSELNSTDQTEGNGSPVKPYVWFQFPINFVTGPLIADLFLLAISAIGKEEVKGGIAGSDHIVPYDILLFFFSLAYIAISIDASGLIRWLAFKVLQLGGKVGHRLFFYLYAFFFGLGSFIGNDPIILSGTAFLAYMTRVSSNIVHPRAWIHTQFAIANIASAILVSSNPTNLVLAGAFKITFINYTRDMVVPVVLTAVFLFPFLLYIVFANESLIPSSIEMHELDAEARARKPINPNIPFGRGTAGEEEKRLASNEAGQQLSLEEIMNPFLDKAGAAFGAVVMTATLITIIVLNEIQSSKNQETFVFYVTVPAAGVMLTFDLAWGWYHRKETRKIARDGRRQVAEAEERRKRELAAEAGILGATSDTSSPPVELSEMQNTGDGNNSRDGEESQLNTLDEKNAENSTGDSASITPSSIARPEPSSETPVVSQSGEDTNHKIAPIQSQKRTDTQSTEAIEEKQRGVAGAIAMANSPRATTAPRGNNPATLVSVSADAYRWLQDTFPTVVAVLNHLPFALLPFSFEMFILVQGLVTNGWVPVFAYGWDHWVNKTGTIGAIGGMGFLSVILCNFAGTNIGTTILLSRVIQAWEEIHRRNMQPIGNRTKWATIYAMALGVNYGAFSIAFSASLAGLLWRDILRRKHIRVRGFEFARVNLPIISVAMTIGLVALLGEVYIFRRD
ncbi:putative arsenite transmembrane transporter protein [Xylaria bambusicola]|uniref:putative arsenite transmembrane transporter protein n=1 Tax=Xylaria bambusicola TaxID=326684 RepID=UPI0020087538|nr:putative arsenite transmembrane transporter protein [Xylaria bambusicola]KAI0517972.1 putative arsenite transmembrane transporter protein [Xylaria bambusicola]